MPDKDGYPLDTELEKIKKWDAIKDPMGLVNYVCELWYYPDRCVITDGKDRLTKKKVKKLYLSTGGWSGNEEIIRALGKNLFWMFCWTQSKRGGHYWFEIRTPKEEGNAKVTSS